MQFKTKKTDSKKLMDSMEAKLEYQAAIAAFHLFVERFNNLPPKAQAKVIHEVSTRSFRGSTRRKQAAGLIAENTGEC